MRTRVLSAVVAAAAFCAWGGEGHRAYAEGDFAAASARFAAELVEDSLSAERRFNLGTSLLAQRRNDEAVATLRSALQTADTALAAKIWYNVGNAQYRVGESEGDPAKRISAWREAIAAWRQSIALDERNEKAKRNVELVQKRLQREIDRQKEEQNRREELSEEAKKALEKAYALAREEKYDAAAATLADFLRTEPTARKVVEAAGRIDDIVEINAGRMPRAEQEAGR